MKHLYWVIGRSLAGRPGPSCKPWDLRELRAGGVDAVVSLDDAVNPAAIKAAGMLHLPAYRPMVILDGPADHREFLTVMRSVVRFLDACQKMGKAAVVHCHHGQDRTGAVLACYLVARKGLAPRQAFEHVKLCNPAAFGQIGYAEAILTFDALLKDDPAWLPPPLA